ncbi:fucose 4-O-acetylase [Paenibacillus sp. H1-7]|uniref:acyltransferase family protein n=1 Tax=Paenibacillus sp. H1-7 TaxID=2282849 RepID=UPI001EF7DE5C|nr:fucose 4-O-acetylase [Paenibacillus sp. H1-7]ULL18644.1 fucose 4-O-acetylase [Paenibacillus sp. H1-7]
MATERKHELNVYFLNVKFVLILLVVTANLLEPMIGGNLYANAGYEAIYTFHIPVFVLVMGYFSKPFKLDSEGLKVMSTLLYQYILFQTLYSAADYLLFRAAGVVHSFFIPYSMLWFVLSHLFWRLLLLLFVRLPHPIVLAVLLGIAVGYWPDAGGWMSISRTFVFFPFFLAGYSIRLFKDWTALSRLIRPFAVIALAALTTALWMGVRIDPGWLYGNTSYSALGHTEWYAGVFRAGTYLLQSAAAVCFLALITWRAGRITEWGKRTVYVFLLQGFVIKSCIALGLFYRIETPLEVAFILLGGVMLTLLLSTRRASALGKPWIEPDFRLLNRTALAKK